MNGLWTAAAQISDGRFAEGVPVAFGGIWERDDRFVMFANEERVLNAADSANAEDAGNAYNSGSADEERWASDQYISILLKTFYAWYLDRTAESASFAESRERIVNDSTSPKAEHIFVQYRPLVSRSFSDDAGNADNAYDTGADEAAESNGSVWEIFVRYPGLKEDVVIPVAVIGDSLYLNFAVKLGGGERADDAADSDGIAAAGTAIESSDTDGSAAADIAAVQDDPLRGFWCKMAEGDGVKVCIPNTAENIYSTYITDNAVYTIRYWRTDMEYSNEKAFFSDGGETFSVVKHIQSAGKIFTCCNGRSVTIRNVQKTAERPKVYELDSSATICGLGSPYLRRVQNVNTKEAVFALFDKAYAQRAPNPDPPFPPSNLDFHMKEINALESGNEIIQAVRERQREFTRSALRQQ